MRVGGHYDVQGHSRSLSDKLFESLVFVKCSVYINIVIIVSFGFLFADDLDISSVWRWP